MLPVGARHQPWDNVKNKLYGKRYFLNNRGIACVSRGLSDSDVGCIVIGNPGVVYDDMGRITMAAKLAEKWADLPIKTLFAQQFSTDIIVMNDINLSAMGEKFRGGGKTPGTLSTFALMPV